jgi:hypothetical protein
LLWDNQKTRGWLAALRLIGDFRWTGVGRGAFEASVGAYRLDHEGVRLESPENLILQITATWGVPIALALVVLFVTLGRRLVRRLADLQPTAQALACGVFAVLVHEMADLALELPGVALPAAAAIGLFAARASDRQPEASRWWVVGAPWSASVLGVWTLALVADVWALPRTQHAEGRRLAAVLAARSPTAPAEIAAAIRRHPADYYLELLAAHDITARGGNPARHLNRALLLNPSDGAPHKLAATWLARTGRRSQAALEYRLASQRDVYTPFDELLRRPCRRPIT